MTQPQESVLRPWGAERYPRSAITQATAFACGPTDNGSQLSLRTRELRVSASSFSTVRVSQGVWPLGRSVVLRVVNTSDEQAI